jgi:hypothetical protein
LWPEAAAILARAKLPRDWVAAGLRPGLHQTLARGIAAVLEQAATMQTIVAEVAAGLPIDIEMLEAVFAMAALAGPEAWGLVIAALLGRLAEANSVLRQADLWTTHRGDPALRAALDLVSESQLARLEPSGAAEAMMMGPDLATAGAEVHRIVSLLDGLSDETAPAARRARLRAIRNRLDASCRTRFASGLADAFLVPLHDLLQAPEPEGPQRLEAAARQLRELEIEGRRLGGASTYDALLRQAAVAVRGIAPSAGLALIEKVRLLELLAGPEEALALLT